MIRLGLLRHGHTAWNRAGRIQGRTDISLDEDALAALRTKRLPPPWDAAHLVCSPLRRTHETAACLTEATPTVEPALIEMDWGRWEGLEGKALKADPHSDYRDIEDWGMTFAPPDGETIAALSARVLGWANTLEQDTLAICHIGVMRVLMAEATGWRFEGPAPFRVKRDRIFCLTRRATGWQLAPEPQRLLERSPCA